MSSFETIINSIASYYILSSINTGNKIIDNSLISLFMLLYTLFSIYIKTNLNFNKIYNYIVYKYLFFNKPFNFYDFKPNLFMALNYEEISQYNYIEFCHMSNNYKKTIDINNNFKIKNQIFDDLKKKLLLMSITFYDQHPKENQPVMNLFFYDIKTTECIYISLNQNTIKIDTYNNFIFHLDNYNIKVNKYTNKRIYNIKKMSDDSVGICYKSNISLKKTLDNIFFDDKIKLINILDKFKNNLLYPPNVTMDNKLGIFLYGPAGTGKTGLVSAIANY
jgi:hypothetical protein